MRHLRKTQYLLEPRPVNGIAEIKYRLAIDLVAHEHRLPQASIEHDGTITHGQKIGNAKGIRELRRARELHLFRRGRIVVRDAARFQMAAQEAEELYRQQVGDISAPVKRRVHEDEV